MVSIWPEGKKCSFSAIRPALLCVWYGDVSSLGWEGILLRSLPHVQKSFKTLVPVCSGHVKIELVECIAGLSVGDFLAVDACTEKDKIKQPDEFLCN